MAMRWRVVVAVLGFLALLLAALWLTGALTDSNEVVSKVSQERGPCLVKLRDGRVCTLTADSCQHISVGDSIEAADAHACK